MLSFLILGLVILAVSAFFIHKSIKEKDNDGLIGFTAILIAALILVLFFGLFFRALL